MTREETIARTHLVVQGLFFSFGLFWLLSWFLVAIPGESGDWVNKDWHCLWTIGTHFVDGQIQNLYTTDPHQSQSFCREGYRWLYPPYALYVVAPLGLLPAAWAYGAIVFTIGVCTVLSFVALYQLVSDRQAFMTLVAVALSTASFNWVVVIGQNTATWLLALTSFAYFMNRKSVGKAALCLCVLGLKPNWMIFVLFWLVIVRSWRVFFYLAACGGVFLLSTLPLGIDVWTSFLQGIGSHAEWIRTSVYPVYKLITVRASLESLFGFEDVALLVAWAIVSCVALAAWFCVCRRSQSLLRQLGITVLLLVSLNAYVSFYDAFILTLPLAAWWGRRRHYPPWASLVIGTVFCAFWLLQWAAVWFEGLAFSPFGFLLLFWILAEGGAALQRPDLEEDTFDFCRVADEV